MDDLALRDYDQAILLKPGFAAAYHNRGHVHQRNKDYQRAVADYSRAIEQAADFDSAYFSRGEAYEAMGALDRATEDFERAYAIDASNPLYRAKLTKTGIAEQNLGALRTN